MRAKRPADVRPATLEGEGALPHGLAHFSEAPGREGEAEPRGERPSEDLRGMVATAANGLPRRRDGRELVGRGRPAASLREETLGDGLGEPRAEIVRAAELEREKDGARRAAIRRGRAERSKRGRIDRAASASFGVSRERLVAEAAARLADARQIGPAALADAAAEELVDGADLAGEATGREKKARGRPADPLERRRG